MARALGSTSSICWARLRGGGGEAELARQQQAALLARPGGIAVRVDRDLRGDVAIRLRDDLLEPLGAHAQPLLDLRTREPPVVSELEGRRLPRIEVVDHLPQHRRVDADLGLLDRQGFRVRRQRHGWACWVNRVRPLLAKAVASPPPRDGLEEAADVPRPLAARPQLEQLGPRVLVQLVRVNKTRELDAQHGEHGIAMRDVVALDLSGFGARQET